MREPSEEEKFRARQYELAKSKFIKSLPVNLSEEEFKLKVAAFSHQWWKLEE